MFLVHSRFVEPESMAPDDVAEVSRREASAAAAFQNDGTLLHLWRETGTRSVWGVWNAADQGELAVILSTLPWSAHMHFEAFEITDHPNSITKEGRP